MCCGLPTQCMFQMEVNKKLARSGLNKHLTLISLIIQICACIAAVELLNFSHIDAD